MTISCDRSGDRIDVGARSQSPLNRHIDPAAREWGRQEQRTQELAADIAAHTDRSTVKSAGAEANRRAAGGALEACAEPAKRIHQPADGGARACARHRR